MITYATRNWLRTIVRVRGTVVPHVLGRTGIVTLLAGVAAYLQFGMGIPLAIPVTVHTIVGLALGLLLVFRTNASYDRYWEGRKLLGGMVNASRNLSRQAQSYLHADAAQARRDVGRYVKALYATIRRYLRGESEFPELSETLTAEERATLGSVAAPPLLVAGWLSELFAREAAAGRLSEERVRLLDGCVASLVDLWGGAERIVKTPVVFAYAHHIKVFLSLFCFTVPLALLASMGWYSPIGSALVAFAMFGIDEIGVEIEDPFGYDPNDLPMEGIGSTITANVDQVFGGR